MAILDGYAGTASATAGVGERGSPPAISSVGYLLLTLTACHFARASRERRTRVALTLLACIALVASASHGVDALQRWQVAEGWSTALRWCGSAAPWAGLLALALLFRGERAATTSAPQDSTRRSSVAPAAQPPQALLPGTWSPGASTQDRPTGGANPMIESAACGVLLVDPRGKIASANSLIARWFGYEYDELLGSDVEILIPLRFREAHQELRNRYMEHPEVRTMGAGRDLYAQRKDGTEFPVEVGLTPVPTPTGPIVMVMMVDTSARKKAQELLQRTIDELAQSNRSLELFTHMASHDLQEPIRNLMSFTTLLEEDLGADLPPAAREDLPFISESAQRMNTLVRALLDLCSIGRTRLTIGPVALDRCVDAAVFLLNDRVKHTNAEVVKNGPLPEVVGDESLLTAVLQNLFANSMKFVAPGTTPRIVIDAKLDGESWRIMIRDNGIGLAAEHAEAVFEPFRRLHRRDQYEGTGMGLTICRKAIERLNGKIWIESSLGQGATFTLRLPTTQSTRLATASAGNRD